MSLNSHVKPASRIRLITVVSAFAGNFSRRLISVIACLTIVVSFSQTAFSDTTTAPDRGFTPGGSYALSDIETIALQSGNLMLNIPLASLPPGRGGLSAGLSLRYNSKLWDVSTGEQDYPATGTLAGLNPGEDGGWHYGYRYSIKLQESGTGFTPFIVMPDGSQHRLCVLDGSGNPDCAFTTYTNSTFVDYFTMDGTYLKIRVTATGGYDVMGMTWTMSMPDGTQVINKPAGTSVAQRTIDRNGNKIDITENAADSNYSNLKTTYIEDDLGRKIVIVYEYDHTNYPNEDKVYFDGFGGEDMFTLVKWRTVNVKKVLKTCQGTCTPFGSYLQNIDQDFKMVERVYLPAPVSAPTQFGGLFYEFDYNDDIVPSSSPQATVGWGEVSKVTLPSDAYAEYEYTTDNQTGSSVKALWLTNNRPTQKELHYDETYDGSTASKTDIWTYGGGTTPTITGPDGGVTTQYFGTVQGFNPGTGDVLLKTVRPDGSITDSYYVANNPIAVGTYDGVANNFVKYEYNTIADSSGSPSQTAIKEYSRDKNGNVTEVKEYDFVAYSSVPRDGNGFVTGLPSGISSSLKRITQTEYYNPVPDSASTTYNDADSYHLSSSSRLRSLPKASEVLNSSSTPQSRSEITYDYTDYSGSNTKGGNPTATKVWDSTKGSYSNPLTSGNWITTSATYDSYGNPTVTTDARGVDTTITYGSVGGYSGLYPTQVEKASNYSGLKLTATMTYDFATGLLLTSTDEDNNDLTNKTEYDKLGRPVLVSAADGTAAEVQTATTYYDTNRYVVVKSDVAALGDGKKVAIQHYDQLGRVRLSRTLEDATSEDATDETDGIKVQTRYKTVSGYRYQIQSNPYRATTSSGASGEATMGWTRSKAWATGHQAETETFSGSTLPYPFLTSGYNTNSTGVVTTETDENEKTITDQAGKKRKGISNALGQMTEVIEDPATLNLSTTYTFDTLGNLRKTTQGSQYRYFMYDSLGRLLYAKQPEQDTNSSLTATDPVTGNTAWSVKYQYDDAGNITSTTDALNKSVAATYDELGRITLRNYSDSTMPDVTFTYDNVTNAKGRLTKVSTSVSTTEYTSFDILGRVTGQKQTTGGNDYTTSYTYKLNGALDVETYPSGNRVANGYATNGDLSNVYWQKPGRNGGYVSYYRATSFVYNAAGAVENLKLGNNNYETTQFNSRMQPTQIGLGTTSSTQDLLKLEYKYNTTGNADNNGSLLEQKITVPTVGGNAGFTATQTYTYDALNRLGAATETISSTQIWKQEFSYDRYGNRNYVTGSGHTTTLGNCTTAICNPSFSSTTNRMTSSGYSYDANGNVTANAAGERFGYDQENHQKEFFISTNSGSTPDATYYYDGDGRRVKKVSSTESTIFVYDAGGKLVEERGTSGNTLQTSYVYAGSRLLSTETSSGTNYLTTDHLGSQRIVTDSGGAVTDRKDYFAYGEEIISSERISALGYTTAAEPRKDFTGYEKDSESGLQFAEARYMNPTHGRFTSVDPLVSSANIKNPQSFNRYIYVLNSPHNSVDPLGLLPVSGTACGQFCANSDAGMQGGGAMSSAMTTQTFYFMGAVIDIYLALPEAANVSGSQMQSNIQNMVRDLGNLSPVSATINIYSYAESTVNSILGSLASEGHSVIVVAHSASADPNITKKDNQGRNPGVSHPGEYMQVYDGWIGTKGATSDLVNFKAFSIKADNLFFFGCRIIPRSANAMQARLSKSGSAFVYNDGGYDGLALLSGDLRQATIAAAYIASGRTAAQSISALKNAAKEVTVPNREDGNSVQIKKKL